MVQDIVAPPSNTDNTTFTRIRVNSIGKFGLDDVDRLINNNLKTHPAFTLPLQILKQIWRMYSRQV